MKKLSLGLICFLALLGATHWHFSQKNYVTPVSQPVAATKAPVQPSPPTRAELLSLVNAERAKYGAAPLVEDSRLDTSAQEKADDEIKYDYFGHISPSESPNAGQDSHNFIFNTGIYCVDSSENITENIHINDAKHAVDAWIASPPHHQAMIDPKYSLTGFGIAGNEIVEHFCET